MLEIISTTTVDPLGPRWVVLLMLFLGILFIGAVLGLMLAFIHVVLLLPIGFFARNKLKQRGYKSFSPLEAASISLASAVPLSQLPHAEELAIVPGVDLASTDSIVNFLNDLDWKSNQAQR